MIRLSGTYQVFHPARLALRQMSMSSKYVYNPSSRSPICSSIDRRRIILAPETQSASQATAGVGGEVTHRDSSFETIPSFKPRSSSDMIPMKRKGEDWISPSGERN